jgi:redox-sensitive bicupin YhaK (pirin superfamily)
MEIRRSTDRGHANHGWLDTHHTFSFAGYMDPRFMGFSHLRVINQDRVAPGRGFGTHPHRNMEILSYVVRGALEHKDTIGTGSVIRPGDVQLMSAGSGIAHSEYNHSDSEAVEFLQIWILPEEGGGAPGYQQHDFGREQGLTHVVSREGVGDTLRIKQNMDLHKLILAEGTGASYDVKRRRAWVQLIAGTLEVNGALLKPGDGLAVVDTKTLTLTSREGEVEALVFDLV